MAVAVAVFTGEISFYPRYLLFFPAGRNYIDISFLEISGARFGVGLSCLCLIVRLKLCTLFHYCWRGGSCVSLLDAMCRTD